MSLTDLGNLGEFVSAIAVLASLIYLGLQVRQSSNQTHVANAQRMLDASKEMILYSSTEDFLELYEKERAGNLTDKGKLRLRSLRSAQLRNVETAFYMYEKKALDGEIFEVFKKRAEVILAEDPELLENHFHSKSFGRWLRDL